MVSANSACRSGSADLCIAVRQNVSEADHVPRMRNLQLSFAIRPLSTHSGHAPLSAIWPARVSSSKLVNNMLVHYIIAK